MIDALIIKPSQLRAALSHHHNNHQQLEILIPEYVQSIKSTTMASLTAYSQYEHYNVTSPSQYVAHVEINRPAKLNAFHRAMWLELNSIFTKLSVDPDVRVIVLTGAGERAFTAGLDVQAAASSEGTLQGSGSVDGAKVDVAREATARRRDIYEFQGCISAVEKCEKRRYYSGSSSFWMYRTYDRM